MEIESAPGKGTKVTLSIPVNLSESQNSAIFAPKDVNEAYVVLTGYARDELIGNASVVLGILTSESRADVLDHLAESGRVQNMQAQIVMKDGEIRVPEQTLPGLLRYRYYRAQAGRGGFQR